MGGSHSREGSELSESDREEEEEEVREAEGGVGEWSDRGAASLDEADRELQPQNAVKLYLHIGGNSPAARWVISDNLATYAFFRSSSSDGEEEIPSSLWSSSSSSPWFLRIGAKICARVGAELRLKSFPDQRRFDFIADGVWSIKFAGPEGYRDFQDQYERCLFEKTYGFEANNDNRMKVFGKDFMAWARPEAEEDSIWAVAEEGFEKSPGRSATPARVSQNLLQEFEEEANEGGIQSLALGVLDNSFLVSDSGIQVLRNFSHGVHGKGVSVKISGDSAADACSTSKKALLTRAETNMLLMSPNAGGIHQLDIETGKVVSEWKFEKDGTDITMRGIENNSKGAQLDPSESTFLGLDDNRLCRWDMRDRGGIVQCAANNAATDRSPVLEWAQGHQFSRGTNFRCFASTGDGSIVVGSLDGKIRLYSKASMRMAKTVFPGLGSPITHVDVTFDGKWILGTTDTYLILVSTVFMDKDGKAKTGFEGRMRDRIAAPRLLKLTPVDSHQAGRNKLHGGQFSWVTESGRQERHLVATVGKSSVYWNFQQVKDSNHECYRNQEGLKSCYCYRIVLKDESIVQSRFMHEKFAVCDSPEAPLVVATPMKVSSFSISRGA